MVRLAKFELIKAFYEHSKGFLAGDILKKLEEQIHPLKRPQGHPRGGKSEKPIWPKVNIIHLDEFALP